MAKLNTKHSSVSSSILKDANSWKIDSPKEIRFVESDGFQEPAVDQAAIFPTKKSPKASGAKKMAMSKLFAKGMKNKLNKKMSKSPLKGNQSPKNGTPEKEEDKKAAIISNMFKITSLVSDPEPQALLPADEKVKEDK